MDRLQHVIEEAKLRTVWWLVCIFIVTYFLTHTSKSMWMNIPIAIAIISGLHIFVTEVEFHWKTRKPNQQSYLSHLERKQLSVNDSRLSTLPPQSKWKRKIDSPVVETAMEDFVNKILQEFVLDLWYANITPDKEAPQLIHSIIMDIFAEISIRVKDINLVDLLTRDLVDLVGDHLELFRKNQAAIGIEVMVTLSSEERDERLKHHLMASNDLHPALISSESEYKFLKRIMGAVLAAVLRTREAQCPLVRCIVRELLTCLVMQPVMRFASPGFINELIAGLLLANDKKRNEAGDDDQSTNITGQNQNHEKSQDLDAMKRDSSSSQKNNTFNDQNGTGLNLNPHELIISGPGQDGPLNPQSFAWARGLEAKTQRRTEVLQPENLENMWTKGRNYKRKSQKKKFLAGINENDQQQNLDGRILSDQSKISNSSDLIDGNISDVSDQNQVGGPIISEFYSANVGGDNDVNINNTGSDKVARTEGQVPKIRCRVLGAYFENISSKSFAVYSIAVTDADNKTWQVKRRYRNFERLHRHLKAIPNYTLQLPPKRIFSSSTEDAFVHQRCIQLDKYLQDLLSIANIAEQHEVWDFLSMTSKRYCFGRSSSVVRKLAVNVDEAVDDMVRQIKGVSGGLKKKAVGSGFESSASFANRNVSFKADELTDSGTKLTTSNSFAQNKGGGPAANVPSTSGLKEDPFGVPAEVLAKNTTDDINGMPYEPYDLIQSHVPYITQKKWSYEWTPTNVSVPLLNLVDNIFQLNRRGWLRRQVFWISKQILQLMMEDAIDDCLLRQIHFLRSDTLVAQGIHWVQNILWPGGIFFLKLRQSQPESSQSNESSCKAPSAAGKNNKGAFEEQLEAARRANDIKNMILDGSPTTLVSLIGQKQYRQSAIDIYYFSQSAVCLKQLGYGLLELVIITVFPELRDIISHAHEKKNDPTI